MSLSASPRLPLEGHIDLSYRCNNACLHCWLNLAPDAPEKREELSADEWRRLIDEARAFGCRRWSFSGGEPLLRPDFAEIFEYATRMSTGYSINTNGTLLTPATARLLSKKGAKMIALYGASPGTYETVTGNPGGFEAVMRGFAYLKEAGARFTVQLIPMAANWHEWDGMRKLARSISPESRIGAPWLFLSADRSPAKNARIEGQRLPPRVAVELDHCPRPMDPPDGGSAARKASGSAEAAPDDRIYAHCIASRREFHVDPYGKMSWCCFVKDPDLRVDLKKKSFAEGWEKFIPSCADRVRGGREWREGCGSCEKRADCRWCGVYSYFETGRHSARVPYLCAMADETAAFHRDWNMRHRKFFSVAGITVCVESELDLRETVFAKELEAFSVEDPGSATVTLSHSFGLPELKPSATGTEIYRKPPWAISRMPDGSWLYRGISTRPEDPELHRIALFSPDLRAGMIYSPERERSRVLRRGWHSLSLFPTDQIWLAPLLARNGCVLVHSAAAIVDGAGFIFAGHSGAGKSTTMELLKAARAKGALDATILCDDRNIIRSEDDGFRVFGTWSHGTTSDVSPESAVLAGILFLEQDAVNRIEPLADRKDIWKRLLSTLIRAAVTAEWWRAELDILEGIVAKVPCYLMRFDASGGIVPSLKSLAADRS